MERPASFKTFIQTTAQSVGIEHLDGNVANALGPDIEYRLREIIQEAIKFMKHSKRSTLCPRDVTHALRLRNVETLYGFSASAGPRKYVRSSQFNNIYFTADDVVDFNQLLQEPELPIPLDVTFSTHWLAIEGVQPAIPLNPSLRKKEKAAALRKKKSQLPVVKPAVSHVLSVELQRFYEEVTKAIQASMICCPTLPNSLHKR
jgi:transcription initiation factor TFIID subunit 6